MAKLLLKVGLVLVVGILGFNFFFGTPEEKESSRQVFDQVKALSSSVVGLLKSEKEKFDQGKYHDALEKVKAAIGIERERAEELGNDGRECLAQCERLQEQEQALEEKLQALAGDAGLDEARQSAAAGAIREEILQLASETETLASRL